MFSEISVDKIKGEHWAVIYQAPLQLSPGSKRKDRRGVGLLMIGLVGLILSVSPMLVDELSYRLNLHGSPASNALLVSTEAIEASNDSLSVKNSPSGNSFNLLIPKIHLNSSVIADVNPYDEKEYQSALKNGLAQATGTGLPGQGGAIYIFGHSSNYLWDQGKYKSAFYLLKNLELNDQIIVSYEGRLYTYKVSNKKVVEPNELSLIDKGTKEQLVLQTCWPPISNFKRLVVFADPIENTAFQTQTEDNL